MTKDKKGFMAGLSKFADNRGGRLTEDTDGKSSEEIQDILSPGEALEKVFTIFRDKMAFTNKRVIFIDVQGIGKKVEYLSVPYRSIVAFSVESAGLLDLDGELKIFISGMTNPIEKKLSAGADVKEISKTINSHL